LDRKDTGLSTWSEKCVFNKSDTIVYCAVPIDLNKASGIFKNEAINKTDDSIYRIDLKTMSAEIVAVPTYGDMGYNFVSAKNLFLSEDEKTLFFIDTKQDLLMNVKLQ